MRSKSSRTERAWRSSVVWMKSSYETSRAFQTARNSSDIMRQYSSGSRPRPLASRSTFVECSSFPMRNRTSKPARRLYRAMQSAPIFSYAVPRCGFWFT